MKFIFSKSVVLTAFLFAFSLAHFAQTPKEAEAGSARMFAGETLVYEGKINRLKLSLSIAELTFTATAAPESAELLVRTQAVSKGTLLKLFRFSFLQQYDSSVEIEKFRVLKTTKHDVQKERVRDSEAIFDYSENLVTYHETDPKDPMRPPRRIASEIREPVYDMISAIYFLRTQHLTVGKKFELSVSDSGLVYQVPVVVTGREKQKTVLGKKTCFKIEPQIFGPTRLIEREGKMVIWMTDDKLHTPVKAQIDSEYGKIEIKLKSVVNPDK